MLHNEKKKLIFSAYPSSPVSYGQEILREERITLQCKEDFQISHIVI